MEIEFHLRKENKTYLIIKKIRIHNNSSIKNLNTKLKKKMIVCQKLFREIKIR